MNKIQVSICSGWLCNKKQATWLRDFHQTLSPKTKSRIALTCGRCEHHCTSDRTLAPLVRVNNQVFHRATPEQIKKAILATA